ncbi:FMN-binding protein [Alkaliphilus pronyensis]|uniref:Ion-translocating oxidoreductase complex subunit G n=1 Tax=Alkaliphilus pronyensis TaxID=1482732 RepID=A0A6I0EYE5_9FIRM|nr:FMN-binding protein [Alkaliphilus pronyensis]KAB3534460.1 FMN-binding protein [Alkaliphilus pronyensis]
MKKFNIKAILFMLVLSVIFTGVLAIINEYTKDRILLNEELKQQKSLLYVLDLPIQEKTAVEVSATYSTNIIEKTTNGITYYEGYRDGNIEGYIFPFEGEAVWGTLKGFIALSTDFSEIVGVDFLSHSETPGLGGRIDELQFKEQFRGIEVDITKDEDYLVYRPNQGGQIDTISGATGTSNAVINILNNNLNNILNDVKEGLEN